MRILFVTKRYYTNQDLIDGRFGRLFHLPVALAELGHEVSVVALDYRGRRGEVHEIQGAMFTSVPLRGIRGLGFWRRIKSIADEFVPGVVIGSADTHFGWIAQRLARRSGCKFVFDLYDNYLSFASARIPGMRRLFGRVVAKADLALAVSDPLLDVATSHGAPAVKIVNGVDRSIFKPMGKKEARDALDLDPDAEYIGYVGSIEPDRGVETMLGALDELRRDGRRVALVAAGVDRLGIDASAEGIDYRGVVPQETVPLLVNACNVVVLPYLATEWGLYTYPNKLVEYIACGVPVVATELPEFVATLGSAYNGLCPPGDTTAMAHAISLQLNEPSHPDPQSISSWPELARSLETALLSQACGER